VHRRIKASTAAMKKAPPPLEGDTSPAYLRKWMSEASSHFDTMGYTDLEERLVQFKGLIRPGPDNPYRAAFEYLNKHRRFTTYAGFEAEFKAYCNVFDHSHEELPQVKYAPTPLVLDQFSVRNWALKHFFPMVNNLRDEHFNLFTEFHTPKIAAAIDTMRTMPLSQDGRTTTQQIDILRPILNLMLRESNEMSLLFLAIPPVLRHKLSLAKYSTAPRDFHLTNVIHDLCLADQQRLEAINNPTAAQVSRLRDYNVQQTGSYAPVFDNVPTPPAAAAAISSSKLIRCNYCNRLGHVERECRTKMRDQGTLPNPPRPQQLRQPNQRNDRDRSYQNRTNNSTRDNTHNKTDATCARCKRKGHYASNCYAKLPTTTPARPRDTKAQVHATQDEPTQGSSWLYSNDPDTSTEEPSYNQASSISQLATHESQNNQDFL